MMGALQIFVLLDMVNLIVASWGTSIAYMAVVDAYRDIQARKKQQINGRTLLVSTKNFRIAWVLGALLVMHTGVFALITFATATITFEGSRQVVNPSMWAWISYSYLTTVTSLLTFLISYNYRDYRKALDYIQVEDSQVVTTVTTTTATAMDIVPSINREKLQE